MQITTYTDLVMYNLKKNMAKLPLEEDFIKWGKAREEVERFKQLHLFMSDLYNRMQETPMDYGLPQDIITDNPAKTSLRQKVYTKVRNVINFLTGLGVLGEYSTESRALCLNSEHWKKWCKENKVTTPQKLQDALCKHGIDFVESNDSLTINYPTYPEALVALTEYTKAIKGSKTNAIFERCDFRVFSTVKWSFTKDDALNSLPREQAEVLSKFIQCIERYNQKNEVKLTFLLRGFWTSSYWEPRSKKATCGYWVENDEVSLKIVFDDISKILPYVMTLPEDFQAKFIDGCPCLKCSRGDCDGRGFFYKFNEKPYLLCKQPWFLYENIDSTHLDYMIMLLEKRMELQDVR